MAHYYFHLWTGKDYELDAIGVDLPDADRACVEAFRAVRDMCSDCVPGKTNLSKYRFDVTDKAGVKLFEVPFSEVFGATSPRPVAYEVLSANLKQVQATSQSLKEEIESAQRTMRASKEVLARAPAQRQNGYLSPGPK